MKKFSEIPYVRPNMDEAKKKLNGWITGIRSASSYGELRNLYLLVDQFLSDIYTMSAIAEVRNTMDKRDEYYEKEQEFLSEATAELSLVTKELMKAVLESPFRSDFDREFGKTLTRSAEIQQRLIQESIVPDMIEENRLCQIYSKDAALCKTTFRGEECNFYGLLKHMESTDREERKEAFHAWAALYESISEKLDQTYDQLVALRVKKAKKLGFDRYVDYQYLVSGHYDYTPEDVANFRKQVREYIVPVCRELYEQQRQRLGIDKLHMYDEALVFPEGNATPIGTKDELVEKARQMYHELSDETGTFFDFMTEYELFDLETRPGKHLGGYCTFFPKYQAPFIFSNFNGTSADVDVLTHEAGHAFQAFVASRTQKLSDYTWSTSEVSEIHSMSMEHFAYPWMNSFFGDKADKYRYAHLCNALTVIPYLVSVDEFQHRVYEHPEMTALERRNVWQGIEKVYMPWRDYDGNEFLSGGGFWMQKQHIFLYPFYYVDYALAQVCAFQFFVRSLEQPEQAWSDYLRLCKAGGSEGYLDLLKLANLDSPFEDGTVQKVVEKVKQQIQKFAEKI